MRDGDTYSKRCIGMKRHRRLFILCWIVLVISAVLYGTIAAPGMYSGHFRMNVYPHPDTSFNYIIVQAETEPRWCWIEPFNHRYTRASLELIEAETQAPIAVDLARGTWAFTSEKGTLDADSIASLLNSLTGPAGSPRSRVFAAGLLEILIKLRDGKFGRPQHHSYQVQAPFPATYQHFTTGQNYGLAGAGLIIFTWPLVILLTEGRKGAGLKIGALPVYAMTLICTLLLNMMLGAIAMASGSGKTSESIEFLLGIANFPAVILMGNAVLSWSGCVAGPVLWATIVSAIVLIRSSRKASSDLASQGVEGGLP